MSPQTITARFRQGLRVRRDARRSPELTVPAPTVERDESRRHGGPPPPGREPEEDGGATGGPPSSRAATVAEAEAARRPVVAARARRPRDGRRAGLGRRRG